MHCVICGKEFQPWGVSGFDTCKKCFFKQREGIFWTGIPKGKRLRVLKTLEEAQDIYSDMWSAYIWGGVGVGKTTLAVNGLFWWRVEQFFKENFANEYLFLQRGSLFSALRVEHEIKSDIASVEHWIDELTKRELIVLDDFGSGSEAVRSDYIVDFWHTVIDEREKERIPTIITSNLSLEQLRDVFGETIPSRIVGLVGDRIYHKEGEDYRLKGGEV